jgi:hypothetical protein
MTIGELGYALGSGLKLVDSASQFGDAFIRDQAKVQLDSAEISISSALQKATDEAMNLPNWEDAETYFNDRKKEILANSLGGLKLNGYAQREAESLFERSWANQAQYVAGQVEKKKDSSIVSQAEQNAVACKDLAGVSPTARAQLALEKLDVARGRMDPAQYDKTARSLMSSIYEDDWKTQTYAALGSDGSGLAEAEKLVSSMVPDSIDQGGITLVYGKGARDALVEGLRREATYRSAAAKTAWDAKQDKYNNELSAQFYSLTSGKGNIAGLRDLDDAIVARLKSGDLGDKVGGSWLDKIRSCVKAIDGSGNGASYNQIKTMTKDEIFAYVLSQGDDVPDARIAAYLAPGLAEPKIAEAIVDAQDLRARIRAGKLSKDQDYQAVLPRLASIKDKGKATEAQITFANRALEIKAYVAQGKISATEGRAQMETAANNIVKANYQSMLADPHQFWREGGTRDWGSEENFENYVGGDAGKNLDLARARLESEFRNTYGLNEGDYTTDINAKTGEIRFTRTDRGHVIQYRADEDEKGNDIFVATTEQGGKASTVSTPATATPLAARTISGLKPTDSQGGKDNKASWSHGIANYLKTDPAAPKSWKDLFSKGHEGADPVTLWRAAAEAGLDGLPDPSKSSAIPEQTRKELVPLYQAYLSRRGKK